MGFLSDLSSMLAAAGARGMGDFAAAERMQNKAALQQLFEQARSSMPNGGMATPADNEIGQLIARVAPETQPSQLQQYHALLSRAAEIDPDKYGGIALEAMSPDALLDYQQKQMMMDNMKAALESGGNPMRAMVIGSGNPSAIATLYASDMEQGAKARQRQAVSSALGQPGLPQQIQTATPGIRPDVASMADNISAYGQNIGIIPSVTAQDMPATPDQMAQGVQLMTGGTSTSAPIEAAPVMVQGQQPMAAAPVVMPTYAPPVQAQQAQPAATPERALTRDEWLQTAEGASARNYAIAIGSLDPINDGYEKYLSALKTRTELISKANEAVERNKGDPADNTIVRAIDRIQAGGDRLNAVTGPFDSMLGSMGASVFGGQKSVDILSDLKQLQDLSQITSLTEARERLGGSFGNMTEKEWPKFQNRLANLDLTQSPDKLRNELGELRFMITGKRYADPAPEANQGAAPPPAATSSQPPSAPTTPLPAIPPAQTPPQQDHSGMNTLEKVLANTGTGVVKGMAGVAALPNLVWQGVNALLPKEYEVQERHLPPSYGDITAAMLGGTGTPEYEPESALGKFGQAATEFATGGGLMPLGMGTRAATSLGALSGLGSEAAGQATEGSEWESIARLGGAILAPSAISSASRHALNRAGRIIGKPMEGSQANRIISDAIKQSGETPERMQYLMQRGEAGDSLAQRVPAMREQVKAQAPNSATATQTAVSAGESQLERSAERIKQAVSDNVSGTQGKSLSEVDDLFKQLGDEDSAPLFQQFHARDAAKGFTESAPRRAIAGIIQRTPEVWNAIVRNARARGVEIPEKPNQWTLGTLHEIKMSLDDAIFKSTDEMTGRFVDQYAKPNAAGRRLLEDRAALNQFLRNKSQAYANANDIASLTHRSRDALAEGFGFAGDKTMESIRKFNPDSYGTSAMTSSEKEAVRGAYLQGVALALKENLPTLANGGVVNFRRTARLEEALGKANVDRFSALLKTEQEIQKSARELMALKPNPVNVSGRDWSGAVSDAAAVAHNPSYGAYRTIRDFGNSVITGRNEAYYRALSDNITNILTTTDKAEIAKRLSQIVRENNRVLDRMKNMMRSGTQSMSSDDR